MRAARRKQEMVCREAETGAELARVPGASPLLLPEIHTGVTIP